MNKILESQIAKYLKIAEGDIPEMYTPLLNAISDTYTTFENERSAVNDKLNIGRTNDKEGQELHPSASGFHFTNSQLISFFEKIDHIYFSVDMLNSCITYISPACEKIYGFSSAEFYANNNLWIEPILPEDLAIIKSTFSNLRKGNACSAQYRIIHADKSTRWLETKLTPSLDEYGHISGLDGITTDITQRKETEEALKINNEELKKSNYELDAFVYSASHDLRAPLTSVLGIIEITKEETGNPFVLEHLKLIQESINKLDDFIKNIIENSNNSNLDVKRDQINFKEVLNPIIEKNRSGTGNFPAVKFRVDIKKKSDFYSDKFRINTVLNNLIENAIQYQNPQENEPSVDIKIDMSDTATNIIIRDNGIGISEEKIQKIFDLFYRGTSKSKGSGLGLYVVKEMITKLKGNIDVHSTPGKGTEFNLQIPNLIPVSSSDFNVTL